MFEEFVALMLRTGIMEYDSVGQLED